MRVTNSELQAFKRCRRRWYLGYYRQLKLKAEGVTGARSIGTRIHAALQGYYAEGADPLAVLEAGLAQDLAAIPEREAEIKKDGDLCRAMLEGYIEWLAETGADADIVVIGTEAEVEVPFTEVRGQQVTLLGKLDLRVQREQDKARLFLDHKTVGSITAPLQMLPMNEQMLHYHLIEFLKLLEETGDEEAATEERTDGGLYNMLRKVKRTKTATPPFYGRHEVRHNIHQLRGYWLRVFGEVSEIVRTKELLDEGTDHRIVCYPSPKQECTWDCDFLPLCPLLDDGSDGEGLIADFYEAGNPFERYADSKEL